MPYNINSYYTEHRFISYMLGLTFNVDYNTPDYATVYYAEMIEDLTPGYPCAFILNNPDRLFHLIEYWTGIFGQFETFHITFRGHFSFLMHAKYSSAIVLDAMSRHYGF